MTPYYADEWLTLYGGDCREVLAGLPADSVDCVVTSPPYWGLRDYGTATWVGGNESCDHLRPVQPRNDRPKGSFHGGTDEGDYKREPQYKERCGKCGAVRQDSQLGLERTPEEYVANMVAVFRELRRVLKPSGTCWLNLGDSYASDQKGSGGPPSKTLGIDSRGVQRTSEANRERNQKRNRYSTGRIDHGLKPKDLVGIPWRVAFALQTDGWYLRSDIVWSKPNPMPESVTDRPTKAHEYLFLLTKAPRYYFDADAVREVGTGRDPGNVAHKYEHMGGTKAGLADIGPSSARNLRSVWTIATRPYPGAHFAVFPPELPERCIKAGSPSGGVILDPFAGSGTVGMVANRLSRRAILIDLNPEYLKQQMARNAQTPLGLAG